MHSSGTISARRASIARPASPAISAIPGTEAAISSGSHVRCAQRTTPVSCSHQNDVIAVSTLPLSGMGSSITTSNAEMRSEATSKRRSSPTA